MFGYVITNDNALSQEQRELYRAYYCGLCKAIGRLHGEKARMTLSYEMTFLCLFLTSLYDESEMEKSETCVIHPLKKHTCLHNPFVDYAADMNILLTYYKYMDDWNDNKSVKALTLSRLFEKSCEDIQEKYPRQAGVIKEKLSELAAAEKRGELNPDIPSGIFGDLLAEIFIYKKDAHEDALRLFGTALGKFIYILDACVDLRKDIKKKQYNPLVLLSSGDFEDILTLLMADTTLFYKELPMKKNTELIENILFSGVWAKYTQHKKKGEKK